MGEPFAGPCIDPDRYFNGASESERLVWVWCDFLVAFAGSGSGDLLSGGSDFSDSFVPGGVGVP